MATIKDEKRRLDSYTRVEQTIQSIDSLFNSGNQQWAVLQNQLESVKDEIDNNPGTAFTASDYNMLVDEYNRMRTQITAALSTFKTYEKIS